MLVQIEQFWRAEGLAKRLKLVRAAWLVAQGAHPVVNCVIVKDEDGIDLQDGDFRASVAT